MTRTQVDDAARDSATASPSDTAVSQLSTALQGFRITICAGGGIAATELPRMARELRRHGAFVRFVVTENALRFIGLTSLEWASAQPVVLTATGLAEHVFDGDAVLVAPATADLLGKAAAGICSDAVTTLLQSAFGLGRPVFFLPTMHESMARSPIVKRNVELLSALPHVHFLEPRREEGKLKAPDPREVALEICHRRNASRNFRGRAPRVALTVGGTRASIDPVRCITNLSSGRLGIHLAEALYRQGLSLVLFRCQTHVALPRLAEAEVVDTAEFGALKVGLEALNGKVTSGIFHVAAVSDYVVESRSDGKLSSDAKELSFKLIRAPKLLALDNLREIPFRLACKLTTGDRAAGLEVARQFARKNDLSACLWNHAATSLEVPDAEHSAVLLVRDPEGATLPFREFALQGKSSIAEAMADAYIAHMSPNRTHF